MSTTSANPVVTVTEPVDLVEELANYATMEKILSPIDSLSPADAHRVWQLLSNAYVYELANAAAALDIHLGQAYSSHDERHYPSDILYFAYKIVYSKPDGVKDLDFVVQRRLEALRARGDLSLAADVPGAGQTSQPRADVPPLTAPVPIRGRRYVASDSSDDESSSSSSSSSSRGSHHLALDGSDDDDDSSSSSSSHVATSSHAVAASSSAQTMSLNERLMMKQFSMVKANKCSVPDIVKKSDHAKKDVQVISLAGRTRDDTLDVMVKALIAAFHDAKPFTHLVQYSYLERKSREYAYDVPHVRSLPKSQTFDMMTVDASIAQQVKKKWPKSEYKHKSRVCVIIDRPDSAMHDFKKVVKHFKSIGAVVIIATLTHTANVHDMSAPSYVDLCGLMGKLTIDTKSVDSGDAHKLNLLRLAHIHFDRDCIFFNKHDDSANGRFRIVKHTEY